MTSPVTVSQGEIETPVGSAPVIPILMIAFGGYLSWFAVKYWRGQGPAVWPSYPIKSVLQGKGLPPNTPAATPTSTVATYEASLPQPGGSQPPPGPQPPSGPNPPKGSYQNMAKLLLSKYGWGPAELPPLIALWTRESGWNPLAQNPTSGALGIAQALGHGVACSQGNLGNEYGPDYGLSCQDAAEANSGSGLQQIRWGLGYIKARYGSPSAAWTHEQAFGWY